MTEQTLVLNLSYEPLKVVHWTRAMTLFAQGKAEVVEEHDRVARSVSFSFRVPSVIRLLRFVKLKRRPIVQFTRANIYARDEYTCQYCAQAFKRDELTFDHVIPVAQGGKRGWENIVSACEPCNRKKAARTPEEAGMTLLKKPHRPLVLGPMMKITVGWHAPEAWQSYLYWNVKLEE